MKDYTIVLSTRGFTFHGALRNVDHSSFGHKENLNGANEISFTVHKYLDEVKEPLWDKLTALAIVYVVELKQFYEIEVQYTDSMQSICTVTGTSLCECELGQTNLYNFDINNEKDANWLEAKNNNQEDYPATIFYDETKPERSLLHRALNKMPHYKIGHVDDSLKNLQRSFSVNGSSVHAFLTSECSEQFDCLFQFEIKKQPDGTYKRIVNVYDLYTVCQTSTCNYKIRRKTHCFSCGI